MSIIKLIVYLSCQLHQASLPSKHLAFILLYSLRPPMDPEHNPCGPSLHRQHLIAHTDHLTRLPDSPGPCRMNDDRYRENRFHEGSRLHEKIDDIQRSICRVHGSAGADYGFT